LQLLILCRSSFWTNTPLMILVRRAIF